LILRLLHDIKERLRVFIHDIREGIKSKYPLCCVLEYAIDHGLRKKKGLALEKGAIIINGKVSNFVPCFIHRRLYKRISYKEALELLNSEYHVEVRYKNELPEIIFMPKITCWNCGHDYWVDAYIKEAIVACPNCKARTKVKDEGVNMWKFEPVGAFVSKDLAFELLEEIEDIWEKLTDVEQERLIEAVKCYTVEAYTACESMCYDALVSVLRRIYGGQKELGYYVSLMEKDPDLKNVKGAIAYLASKRNEVDHPERISNRLEATNALNMTKQLIREILTKKAGTQ